MLAVNPWDLPTLTAMATAAAKSGDLDCELCYLKAAVKGSPKNYVCNRLFAIAMTERGQVDQAITWWHRVEEIRPDDEEAKRSIAALTVQKARSSGKFDDDDEVSRKAKIKSQQQEELTLEHRLQRKIRDEPNTMANYLELAQLFVNAERYQEAENLLAKAFELSDGDIDIRDKWEDCQIRHLRQKIATTQEPEAKKKFIQAYLEKDLEFYQSRVERYPNKLDLKYELGYRYMKMKRFDEAIRELQAAMNDPRRRGMCLLVLGECFQQIKQFPLARKHYEAAIQEIPVREAENKKKALYLAGRLALFLRDLDVAKKDLETLATLDFNYKDVSALLDKIAKLRENQEPDKDKDDRPQEGNAEDKPENREGDAPSSSPGDS